MREQREEPVSYDSNFCIVRGRGAWGVQFGGAGISHNVGNKMRMRVPRKPAPLEGEASLSLEACGLCSPGLLTWGWHLSVRRMLCVPAWKRWHKVLYTPYGAPFAFRECSAVHSVSLMRHMQTKHGYIYPSPGSWSLAMVGLTCPRRVTYRLFQFSLWSGP